TTRGVQGSRKQRQVSGGVEEDAGQAQDPVDRAVDVGLLLERLVPRRMRPGVGGPGAAGDRLDDLHGDVPLPADAPRLLEVLPVTGHPRPDAELGVAGPRGGVDVVDAVPEQQVERAIGVGLTGPRQRGPAEEGHRARVTGASERASLDHHGSRDHWRCFSNQAKTFFQPSTAACTRYCGRSTAKNACPAFSYVWNS